MLFPTQRPRNFNPENMHRGPNNFMFPNHGLNRPVQRNNIQSIMQHFTQPQSSASMVNKGVGGLSKTLTNVQQVLKVVQSTAPIVQEYGPMVKNLPAMYKMMKAFKEIESSNEEKVEDMQFDHKEVTESDNTIKPSNNVGGKSTPKLFI